MSMLLQINPEPGLLNVVATGEFSLEEAKRTFLQMLEAVAFHKSKKVLFDGLQLTGNPQTMERFFYGEFAAKTVQAYVKRGISASTPFAYVLKEPVLDPWWYGEEVARNLGMNVRTFQSMEMALMWLEFARTG